MSRSSASVSGGANYNANDNTNTVTITTGNSLRVSSAQRGKMDDLDLINRDPNSINDHLKVNFDDVLAEPEGAHSMDCVWKNSYRCFTCWKNLCYTIHTLLCGICIAMEWGCEFAYIAFVHIWFITPCFKVLELNCGCLQKLYGMCVHCALDPLCEACGLLFYAFKKA